MTLSCLQTLKKKKENASVRFDLWRTLKLRLFYVLLSSSLLIILFISRSFRNDVLLKLLFFEASVIFEQLRKFRKLLFHKSLLCFCYMVSDLVSVLGYWWLFLGISCKKSRYQIRYHSIKVLVSVSGIRQKYETYNRVSDTAKIKQWLTPEGPVSIWILN